MAESLVAEDLNVFVKEISPVHRLILHVKRAWLLGGEEADYRRPEEPDREHEAAEHIFAPVGGGGVIHVEAAEHQAHEYERK